MIIRHLLWPKTQGLRNRWKRAKNSERLLIIGFSSFGVLFWIGLSALFWYFIKTFYSIEIVGPIVLRKLMELLMLSLFGMLCFSNVVTALSSFYLSDDLELLLSLPISRVQFHMARLSDTIGQSSWMAIALGGPILACYGAAYQATWDYYVIAAAVLSAFLIIPAALGVGLASLLVSIFPARRIREALMLVGVITLVFIFILLRWLRPERLANADNFESVAAYVAELQAPTPFLLPPKWASEALLASLLGRPFPWLEFSLLIVGAIATNGLARWLTDFLYDEGRAKAQEARVARLAGSKWLDSIIRLWTFPLSPNAQAMVTKDIKTFVRDPSQWTQLFLVASIVAISIISVASLPVDSFRGPWMQSWINGLSFLILALVGFVMAALAARFQFSAVSNEGRGFWIVRTGPISAREFLKAKAWPGFLPMLLIGETLAISSTTILGAEPLVLWTAILTAIGLSFGLSGIAVGMGAMYPDFKSDNAAKLAASPAGMLYMVMALSLVFAVLILEAFPIYFFLSSRYRDTDLNSVQWLISGGCFLSVVALCAFAAIYPMRRGARALWERELPNG
ncbi:MAG: hypothetical protein VXZ96_02835 [Myxococcota bacterium]|nr:hypothetical protein [Myxococcota bacterium]